MIPRACLQLFQRQPVETGRIEDMHRPPAVASVAHIGGLPESERLVSVGMQFILMTDGAFMVANDYLHLREAETGLHH